MENKVRQFQDLRVWQKSHQLTLALYRATKSFPREEIYGLTSQLRKAIVSVGANIAEGSKRQTTNDLCHFLDMAEGSNEEVKCLLMISRDIGYLSQDLARNLLDECDVVGAMLNGLLRSLRH